MSATPTSAPGTRSQSVLLQGLLGSLLLVASFPPLSLSWLAWVAPLPWLRLAVLPELKGRRPYRQLWLAGWIFWALAIHWIRLPHPANWLSWLALTALLGCFLPAFIAITRIGVWRWQLPIWVVAPVGWTGLEFVRAHLLTGFLMASLAHTQVRHIVLIQISDLTGEYGVGFVVMLIAASALSICLPRDTQASESRRRAARWWPALPAIIVMAAVLAYGQWRLEQTAELATSNRRPRPRVALIQGNIAAVWKTDAERQATIMREYAQLSRQAREQAERQGGLDLIVWPETMYRNPLLVLEENPSQPINETDRRLAQQTPAALATLVRLLDDTPVLVGLDRYFKPAGEKAEPLGWGGEMRVYNSSAMVDASGEIVGYYDKMHRVMFGEYIPFAQWFPSLYRWTPLTGGIDPGAAPQALELAGVRYAPNICYETVLPHVIRSQVAELSARGTPADVLVNLTNDAWFWGSSELDMHLACGVFRAVETRTPLLIAANGGISADIDSTGAVRQQSPRQAPHVLIAQVLPDPRLSPYVRYGDWFAITCFLGCLLLVAIETWRRYASPPRHNSPRPPNQPANELPA